jgi:hypothetical protein
MKVTLSMIFLIIAGLLFLFQAVKNVLGVTVASKWELGWLGAFFFVLSVLF